MQRIRVLSVDDYAPLREYLRTIFQMEEGMELVGEAENGQQAIEEARRLRPDVIIMDVDMPVLNGLEATRQILREQPQTKVIFLVAEVTWRTQAQAAGASAFLLKDTPPDQLVATILAQVPEPVAVPAGPRLAQAWTVLGQRLSLVGSVGSRATADAWTSVRRWLVQEQWPRLKDPGFQRSFRRTLGLVAGLAAAVAIAWTVDVAALARQMTIGGVFSFISLSFGLFFFAYAARYYASIALILAVGGNGNRRNGNGYPNGMGLRRNGFINGLRKRIANGLQNHNGNSSGNGNDNGIRLDRQPFVSIHLPTYNEQRVIDRLLAACTSFDYENYEVIVGDDSSDDTLIHLEEWAKHPRVKVSHRINRKGFKGAALKKALEIMDRRTEFVIIYDADFVPGPDMIQQYLAYFYGLNGSNSNHNGGKGNGGNRHSSSGNGGNNGLADERVAAVQGYQWHMLNADENWITKGIRAEYSGSYVVERSGQELVGTMKMISGSVYMIRADVLRRVGWGTSITEDWELTIKLYLAGYRVLYTPFIQAPAECVSSFKELVKQRMRWAEGHTHQIKKYFRQVMTSPNFSRREKLEFLYYAPYYLQSVFFIVGTTLWLLSDTFFHDYLPYWRSLFGWSLVFTNAAALALMNLAGLFLERGAKRDFGGVLSVIFLGYLLAPFQAYAALKGLLEKEEGGWNRTPKSGRITGALARLQLSRRLRWLLGAPRRRRPRPQGAGAHFKFLAAELWPWRWRSGLAYGTLAFLLAGLLYLGFEARSVTPVAAANDTFNLHADADCTTTDCTMDDTTGAGGSVLFDASDGLDTFTWDSVLVYPTGDVPGNIPAGDYTVTVFFSQSAVGGPRKTTLSFTLSYGATEIASSGNVQFKAGTPDVSESKAVTLTAASDMPLDHSPKDPLTLEIALVNQNGQTMTVFLDQPTGDGQTNLVIPGIVVDELGWRLLLLIPLVPAVPLLVTALRRRKARRSSA